MPLEDAIVTGYTYGWNHLTMGDGQEEGAPPRAGGGGG